MSASSTFLLLLAATLVPAASALINGIGLGNTGARPGFTVVPGISQRLASSRQETFTLLRAQADAASSSPSIEQIPRCINNKILPRRFLKPVSVNVDDLLDSNGKFRSDLGPRVAGPDSNLPESMKGLFWLADQKQGSSIASFAKSQDGGCLGTGQLEEGLDSIKIRASGDRSWSYSDKAGVRFFVKTIDLVYHFRADSITDPTNFTIVPHAYVTGKQDKIPEDFVRNFLRFDMSKVTPEQAKEEGYPGSQLWYRPTYSQALADGKMIKEYNLVQIVDANSNPIQPAYNKWIEYSKSEEAGETPGFIHYWEAMPRAKRVSIQCLVARASLCRSCLCIFSLDHCV